MKALLTISAVLICVSILSTSCHQGYVCNCQMKDTTAVIRNQYSISANSISAATSQCNNIQAQHTGDSCIVMILKD